MTDLLETYVALMVANKKKHVRKISHVKPGMSKQASASNLHLQNHLATPRKSLQVEIPIKLTKRTSASPKSE